MRRFKYLFTKRINKKLLNKRVNLLDDEASHKYKANMLISKTFAMLYFTLMAIFIVTMIIFEQKIKGVIGKPLFVTLVVIGSFILPTLILYYPYTRLERKFPYHPLGNITKEVIAQCNYSLFKFYKIPKNYIITKCYDSSNDIFVNKDLILFFYKDRLRIVNDFTKTIKDFGCFEFRMNEIELFYEKRGKITATVIKSDKITLTLGKRAKPYIIKRES